MRIKYKHPYWVKYSWDLSEHHDNQYVTIFDKEKNYNIYDFQHKEKFIITTNFTIKEKYKIYKIHLYLYSLLNKEHKYEMIPNLMLYNIHRHF